MKNSQEVDGSFLKKFTLVMLSGMVTFIVSSFKTGFSGEGKKSSTNLTLPIGSFLKYRGRLPRVGPRRHIVIKRNFIKNTHFEAL